MGYVRPVYKHYKSIDEAFNSLCAEYMLNGLSAQYVDKCIYCPLRAIAVRHYNCGLHSPNLCNRLVEEAPAEIITAFGLLPTVNS